MAWCEFQGGALHYLERGRGEPVMLLHGLGSSGADWALQAPPLEQHFRLIIPDLPGSGYSTLPARCSIAGFAQALWALLAQLELRRINLVGFSLGGAVALEMALQRPGSVPRLALINSLASYRLDDWRKRLEAYAPQLLIPLIGMRVAARLAARRLFPRPGQAALRDRAARVVSAVPAATYLSIGRALIGWSALDRLQRLRSRILMLAAQNDLTSLEEKRRHAAALNARLIVVRGSRHGTPFDAVKITNESLLAHLRDRPLPLEARWTCDAVSESLDFGGSLADEHARVGERPERIGRGVDTLHPAF